MDRIETAYSLCSAWIATNDGVPREAFLAAATRAGLVAVLDALRGSALGFNFSPTWSDLPQDEADWTSERIADELERGTLANGILTLITTEPGFRLDLQVILEHAGEGRFDFDAVFWPDLVFGAHDVRQRFGELLDWLAKLQERLGATGLYLSRENLADPRQADSGWVAV